MHQVKPFFVDVDRVHVIRKFHLFVDLVEDPVHAIEFMLLPQHRLDVPASFLSPEDLAPAPYRLLSTANIHRFRELPGQLFVRQLAKILVVNLH